MAVGHLSLVYRDSREIRPRGYIERYRRVLRKRVREREREGGREGETKAKGRTRKSRFDEVREECVKTRARRYVSLCVYVDERVAQRD